MSISKNRSHSKVLEEVKMSTYELEWGAQFDA